MFIIRTKLISKLCTSCQN